MKRIVDVDMLVKCKKVETAFNRFFQKISRIRLLARKFRVDGRK